jgi:hypothetical protein
LKYAAIRPLQLRDNPAVWAAAFAVMVAVNLTMIHTAYMRLRRAIIITILALYGASKFTVWYPTRDEGKK